MVDEKLTTGGLAVDGDGVSDIGGGVGIEGME